VLGLIARLIAAVVVLAIMSPHMKLADSRPPHFELSQKF
jgi:hypothetical protein